MKNYWVAIPFPTRESAESTLCEVEEMGFRAAVVTTTKAMEHKYAVAPDLRGKE